jgi:pimeloyl-ACP methyl ester carboxylesterase
MPRLVSLLTLATCLLGRHDATQAQQPTGPAAAIDTQKVAPARPEVSTAALLRFEPTGLSLLRPYASGKIPVVLVHGLWMNPWSWHRMVEKLEEDPDLRERYQFWTFGYSTGDPIPYSAFLMRHDLEEARRTLDPDRSDRAFERMVIVGHSMGGLLTKMMAVDPGDRLWRVVADRPFAELQGERDDLDLFRGGLRFDARPEVRRVVFIATPHQGSRFDKGSIQRVGTRLVRMPDPLRAAHRRLVERNAATFFRDHFRKGLPSSIDELEWGSPMLRGLNDLPLAPAITSHSIIAVRPDSPPGARTDGLVSFDSAHLAGVASEKVISTGHLCQDHPDVIEEVRRILVEHLAP